MNDHPIQALMKTAMESIKEMVDVNTVVGDPVETADGTVIIPVSRVSFGFAAGGGEYEVGDGARSLDEVILPFGGGSGAGVSVQPVGFLVVSRDSVRMLPIDRGGATFDRLIDMAPQFIEQLKGFVRHDHDNGETIVSKRTATPKTIRETEMD